MSEPKTEVLRQFASEHKCGGLVLLTEAEHLRLSELRGGIDFSNQWANFFSENIHNPTQPKELSEYFPIVEDEVKLESTEGLNSRKSDLTNRVSLLNPIHRNSDLHYDNEKPRPTDITMNHSSSSNSSSGSSIHSGDNGSSTHLRTVHFMYDENGHCRYVSKPVKLSDDQKSRIKQIEAEENQVAKKQFLDKVKKQGKICISQECLNILFENNSTENPYISAAHWALYFDLQTEDMHKAVPGASLRNRLKWFPCFSEKLFKSTDNTFVTEMETLKNTFLLDVSRTQYYVINRTMDLADIDSVECTDGVYSLASEALDDFDNNRISDPFLRNSIKQEYRYSNEVSPFSSDDITKDYLSALAKTMINYFVIHNKVPEFCVDNHLETDIANALFSVEPYINNVLDGFNDNDETRYQLKERLQGDSEFTLEEDDPIVKDFLDEYLDWDDFMYQILVHTLFRITDCNELNFALKLDDNKIQICLLDVEGSPDPLSIDLFNVSFVDNFTTQAGIVFDSYVLDQTDSRRPGQFPKLDGAINNVNLIEPFDQLETRLKNFKCILDERLGRSSQMHEGAEKTEDHSSINPTYFGSESIDQQSIEDFKSARLLDHEHLNDSNPLNRVGQHNSPELNQYKDISYVDRGGINHSVFTLVEQVDFQLSIVLDQHLNLMGNYKQALQVLIEDEKQQETQPLQNVLDTDEESTGSCCCLPFCR